MWADWIFCVVCQTLKPSLRTCSRSPVPVWNWEWRSSHICTALSPVQTPSLTTSLFFPPPQNHILCLEPDILTAFTSSSCTATFPTSRFESSRSLSWISVAFDDWLNPLSLYLTSRRWEVVMWDCQCGDPFSFWPAGTSLYVSWHLNGYMRIKYILHLSPADLLSFWGEIIYTRTNFKNSHRSHKCQFAVDFISSNVCKLAQIYTNTPTCIWNVHFTDIQAKRPSSVAIKNILAWLKLDILLLFSIKLVELNQIWFCWFQTFKLNF